MALSFGIFDHIEPVPGLRLDQIYRERLIQIERLDRAGFYAYHLAEHHTPPSTASRRRRTCSSAASPSAPGASGSARVCTCCRSIIRSG
jgi:hypothetical protein